MTRETPLSLPPDTRVQGLISDRVGTVQHHIPNQLGTFPIAWNNGQWSVCAADDVTVIAPPQKQPTPRKKGRAA